jgi:predicted kinase
MPAVKQKNPPPPVLYVFFGMIATGKSTVAQAWARHKGGLCTCNSDRIRKDLAGIKPTAAQREAVDAGIYAKEFSKKTYETLRQKAQACLQQGDSVILDASYQYARDRQELRDLAKSLNCRIYFILCTCSEREMKRRMDLRAQDPASVSDGRWEIYLKQRQRFEPPDELAVSELIIIDTRAPVKKIVQELEERLP